MTSKLPQEKHSQENSQIMFQICVPNQKVHGNNAMIRNSKYTMFLILLKFKNLWNLINVFIKNFYEKILK